MRRETAAKPSRMRASVTSCQCTRGASQSSPAQNGQVDAAPEPGIDLYWLPLGAGGHSVRYNGRAYDWILSRLKHRRVCELYHSALEIRTAAGRFVVESTPVPRGPSGRRGVVAQGAVGTRWAGCFRVFRYEIRCWLDGVIPDVAEAVDRPQRLTNDPALSRAVVELVRKVPAPVWGRDELATGEMWNSNSVVSWLIESSGLDAAGLSPPPRGRAPGWAAGVEVARRGVA